RMAQEVSPKIAAQSASEHDQALSWEGFERFFREFLGALPPFSRFLFRQSVVFEVPSSPEPFWVVDLRRKRVHRATTPPPDCGSIVRIPEALLADAMKKRILNFVHISLRISIELKRGGARTDFLFWALLTLWELGYFPMLRVLRPRALG